MSKQKIVTIVGAGVIGAGWAARMLACGLTVNAYDPSEKARKQLLINTKKALKSLQKIGLNKNSKLSNLKIFSNLRESLHSSTFVQENAPENDGIYRLEINTGEVELILSLCDLREFQPVASMDRAIHWVTHLEINPNSSRFLFIHRWTERVEDETCFLHRLFTVKSDGSDLRLLECTDHPLPQLADSFDRNKFGTFDYEKSEHQISHPMWKDDRQIIVWGPHSGSIHYHLYDNLSGRAKVIGENLLTENGHMSFSPNKEWILSDTYPDESTNERLLILYDVKNEFRYDIGSFYTDPNLGKHNRCDLHPRWNLNGREVCIDSVHELTRQIYIIDVSSITCN